METAVGVAVARGTVGCCVKVGATAGDEVVG